MGLTVEHRGFREVKRRLRQLGLNSQNLIPVWPHVGNYIARAEREVFATRGLRLGKAWKPLAPRTLAEKARAGWPRAPLVRTGRLKFSLSGRPMAIEIYRPKTATFGTDLDVAVWQDKGTHRHGRRHIPPRKLIGLTEEDRREIVRIVRKHVMKGRRRV